MTLWHNPRCATSRAALALLTERGIDPTIRLYLEQPPSEAEIVGLLRRLEMPAIGLVRTTERAFHDLGLADGDDNALVRAMARTPILIERPILVAGPRAVIGRPPAKILALL